MVLAERTEEDGVPASGEGASRKKVLRDQRVEVARSHRTVQMTGMQECRGRARRSSATRWRALKTRPSCEDLPRRTASRGSWGS